MDASQYKITFPYGATDPPYGTAALPYHRGEDRVMPSGTPVIVNGVQVGLSNNTGLSTGSHLHIGRFVNGKDTPPGGQGFNLKPPVRVTTVASDATNGNYVRLTDGDGVQWVYLHLQSQSVQQGQELKSNSSGGDMPTLPTKQQVAEAYLKHNLGPDGQGIPATQQDIDYYSTQPVEVLYAVLLDHETTRVHELVDQVNSGDAGKKLAQIKAIIG